MNKKVSNLGIVIAFVFLLILLICLGANKSKNETETLVEPSEYIVAAHYFADEWPANFWNAEWNYIDNDFQQIKEDGFNTIIVVIPWREFQPTINTVSYNEHVIDRMDFLFQKAEEHGLQVQLRVGYMHDFYSEEDPAQRFYDIMYDEDTQSAWYDYLSKIYEVSSKYNNFLGGFITWEDFWHNYALVDYVGGTDAALSYPTRTKFVAYIKEKYALDEFNSKYNGNFSSYEEIPIPKRDDVFAEEWFAFVDDFTMDLLRRSREQFPGLNMEVRTDKDPIGTSKGKNGKYSHEGTWDCAGADHMTIMYQPLQGNHSISKHISASAGAKNLENWLKNIYERNGNIPIYIDQFLYYDNTPSNDEGDIIDASELGDYIELCEDAFKKYTMGYGVWTYKDYCANMLYNPQFILCYDGWECNEYVNIKDNMCRIQPQGKMEQKIPVNRRFYIGERTVVEIDIKSIEQSGYLWIALGEKEKKLKIYEGKMVIEFETDGFDSFIIRSDNCDIWIDNVKVYTHIQKGGIYDIYGKTDKVLKNVQRLNCKINN